MAFFKINCIIDGLDGVLVLIHPIYFLFRLYVGALNISFLHWFWPFPCYPRSSYCPYTSSCLPSTLVSICLPCMAFTSCSPYFTKQISWTYSFFMLSIL